MSNRSNRWLTSKWNSQIRMARIMGQHLGRGNVSPISPPKIVCFEGNWRIASQRKPPATVRRRSLMFLKKPSLASKPKTNVSGRKTRRSKCKRRRSPPRMSVCASVSAWWPRPVVCRSSSASPCQPSSLQHSLQVLVLCSRIYWHGPRARRRSTTPRGYSQQAWCVA